MVNHHTICEFLNRLEVILKSKIRMSSVNPLQIGRAVRANTTTEELFHADIVRIDKEIQEMIKPVELFQEISAIPMNNKVSQRQRDKACRFVWLIMHKSEIIEVINKSYLQQIYKFFLADTQREEEIKHKFFLSREEKRIRKLFWSKEHNLRLLVRFSLVEFNSTPGNGRVPSAEFARSEVSGQDTAGWMFYLTEV